jgi:hypothetical protein
MTPRRRLLVLRLSHPPMSSVEERATCLQAAYQVYTAQSSKPFRLIRADIPSRRYRSISYATLILPGYLMPRRCGCLP